MLLGAVVFLRFEGLQQQLASEIRLFPFVVFIVGAILCLRFHQVRIFMALLLLAIADRSLALSWTGEAARTDAGLFTFLAVSTLLPLNMAALAYLPERDILSPEGIKRMSVIIIQVIVVFLLRDHVPGTLLGFIGATHGSDGALAWTALGIPALIAFLAALVALVIRLSMKPDAINRGFFWAVVAIFLAMNSDFNEFTATFYFATTGLILTIAVIESSYSMAYQDGLTGLPSRRALNQAMMRLGGTFTIAMVDVDHFKKFNDEHGHDVGDQVLRKVARELTQVTGGGKAFRYGGEEFAVLYPRKRKNQVYPHLERLRMRIANSNFTLRSTNRPPRKPKHPVPPENPKRLSITVSIGAAQREDHYDKPEDVIRRADEALYTAKEAGRNRVKLDDEWADLTPTSITGPGIR